MRTESTASKAEDCATTTYGRTEIANRLASLSTHLRAKRPGISCVRLQRDRLESGGGAVPVLFLRWRRPDLLLTAGTDRSVSRRICAGACSPAPLKRSRDPPRDPAGC